MATTHARASGAFSGSPYGSFDGKDLGAHAEGIITQARASGAFSGIPYGSFSGKNAASSQHPVGALTQFRSFGAFTGMRYGSFARIGRLTQYRAFGAFTGMPYGSFFGRPLHIPPVEPPVEPPPPPSDEFHARPSRPRRQPVRPDLADKLRRQLIDEDELIALLFAEFYTSQVIRGNRPH